ncbi:hypothetical protein BO78DRAFT_139380 [Aspergillus sclerotiicarbonarius CBS 121057]|uniref:Uncharacterized protein n=1 Tax=Aspergillus sclerotiicarbonarius (strain CBS 121057 / IBT 28362) TaxID=1448318 RepID=A0A319EVT9_ASPSB|nr:hypothetical protein BO78DRAFT_139380 [Aspergillus sclerotiicarbonarius CBS 121057]
MTSRIHGEGDEPDAGAESPGTEQRNDPSADRHWAARNPQKTRAGKEQLPVRVPGPVPSPTNPPQSLDSGSPFTPWTSHSDPGPDGIPPRSPPQTSDVLSFPENRRPPMRCRASSAMINT